MGKGTEVDNVGLDWSGDCDFDARQCIGAAWERDCVRCAGEASMAAMNAA